MRRRETQKTHQQLLRLRLDCPASAPAMSITRHVECGHRGNFTHPLFELFDADYVDTWLSMGKDAEALSTDFGVVLYQKASPVWLIHYIFVKEEFRQQGHGSRLMQALMELHAHFAGLSILPGSEPFWMKHGFELRTLCTVFGPQLCAFFGAGSYEVFDLMGSRHRQEHG